MASAFSSSLPYGVVPLGQEHKFGAMGTVVFAVFFDTVLVAGALALALQLRVLAIRRSRRR